MEIRSYTESVFNNVIDIVHKIHRRNLSEILPKRRSWFFHNHHSEENMKNQLPNEFTLILFDKTKLFGTETLFKNEIKRFLILPDYQGKGYGKRHFQKGRK